MSRNLKYERTTSRNKQSWKKVASFSTNSKGLLHPGVTRLTLLDLHLLLESHHFERRKTWSGVSRLVSFGYPEVASSLITSMSRLITRHLLFTTNFHRLSLRKTRHCRRYSKRMLVYQLSWFPAWNDAHFYASLPRLTFLFPLPTNFHRRSSWSSPLQEFLQRSLINI